MEVTEEDKKRVELLLKKFKPRILRLAVNYVSFDSSVSEMKNYLKEHPIDPQYDEPEGYIVLDGNTPPSQLAARGYYDILKKLGELPE